MLSRLIPKSSHFRLLSNLYSKSQSYPASNNNLTSILVSSRFLSTSDNNNNSNNSSKDKSTGSWQFTRESDGKLDNFFSEDSGNLAGISGTESLAGGEDDVFGGADKETAEKVVGGDEWMTAEGYKPWSLLEEEKDDVFDIGEVAAEVGETGSEESSSVSLEMEKSEENKRLEIEERQLTAVLKGPNHAFGDLIAASGITNAMLDSLIALKDLEGIEGLPPLSEIEDMRYEKNTRKSSRADIERLKQEEIAKARVRQVDDKGRAYGTGRRKCSIARVWVQPGDGKFVVNDKEFDTYFPMLDHRAALLRPFSETKTLGLWDVKCTVKGGGVSGQVDAIRLGISRALQNWEPDLRTPLRSAGFLTRDSRVVERKKPGKAKARKSFQWVKR
ncbi:ribosomal protein S5 domain 2-like superfamily protein [Tripterygium wilfordii]|uniref:Ribosomal protein S5 domain 2-like superfamily protein n=1 Tax=Tripterygium wilfordii TaxID=458696 RepID=A0A7J7D2I4_TRIWF|nr:30S ribosomal protein S9, mitochondrial-like [Tripterygium wilfordii]KAF5740276.1 ribosomal protein S5 domain 2-like superfamily protein [Tripterygium wilfordii]